jgi:hypothetical protein
MLQRRTDVWRRQHGGCLVCGQPVAAPQYRMAIDGRLPYTMRAQDAPPYHTDKKEEEEALAALDSDGRLLTEESPVRLCLMRFNALGQYEAAHIVDDYTLLEDGRRKASLRSEFQKYEAPLQSAHPQAFAAFKDQVLARTPEAERLYDEAVALGKRVINGLTVCACVRCNTAMNRTATHAAMVYRCFSVTRDARASLLEDTQKHTTHAKKVIQQIALFFTPTWTSPKGIPRGEKPSVTWHVKPERQLLLDAALWRCLAHLADWGASPTGGGQRQRWVALFHAAYYVYLSASSGATTMDLAAWHLHLWRPFYAAHYPAHSTFLGLHQSEIARLLDPSARTDGQRWETWLKARLSAVVDRLEATHPQPEHYLTRLLHWETALADATLVDEHDLYRFLTRQHPQRNARAALIAAWAFFRFNLQGNLFLMRQLDTLTRELARVVQLTLTPRPPRRLVLLPP